MNRPKSKRQPKPKNVEEWRERVFQRVDQVLGQGAHKRHHERVLDAGGAAVSERDSDNRWKNLDPVAVANGIAAEEVGQRVIEEPAPRMPGEPVAVEVDTEWLAMMEAALKCEIRVAEPFKISTSPSNVS